MFLALKWGSARWRGIGAECNGRRLHGYFCLYQRGLCWSSSSLPHTPVGSWCIMRLCTFNNTANYRELGVCERVNSGFLKAQPRVQTGPGNDAENWWDLRGFLFSLKKNGTVKTYKRAKVKGAYRVYERTLSYITNARHEVCALLLRQMTEKALTKCEHFDRSLLCYIVPQKPSCQDCYFGLHCLSSILTNMFIHQSCQ